MADFQFNSGSPYRVGETGTLTVTTGEFDDVYIVALADDSVVVWDDPGNHEVNPDSGAASANFGFTVIGPGSGNNGVNAWQISDILFSPNPTASNGLVTVTWTWAGYSFSAMHTNNGINGQGYLVHAIGDTGTNAVGTDETGELTGNVDDPYIFYWLLIEWSGYPDGRFLNGEGNVARLGVLPIAPATPVATVLSSTSISVDVTDNSFNEQLFVLERSAHSANSWSTVQTGNLPLVDTGLTAATTYDYRVKARNDAGDSTASGTTSATTSAGGTSVTVTLTRQTATFGAAATLEDIRTIASLNGRPAVDAMRFRRSLNRVGG